MKVLKGILSESKTYYLDTKKRIELKLKSLPKGIVKRRKIGGRIYYYLQYREGIKIVHKYIGKAKPEIMLKQIKERKSLKAELKKIIEALKIIRRSEGRKR